MTETTTTETINNNNNSSPQQVKNEGEKIEKKKRQQYIYELIGRITEKRQKKPSPSNQVEGKKYDDYFYQLKVSIENKEVNKLFVFKNSLATEKVWQDIEASEYIDKRYLFYCHNYKGLYRLVNWKELTNQEAVISHHDRDK